MRSDILDAYDMVFDTISMSVSILCGGWRVYQQSLDFDSLANTLALEMSIALFINFILKIDFDFYSIDIYELDDKYTLILSLKTTLVVCA